MQRIDALAAAVAARYRIERPLGAGGMATVYLAQDLRHNRPVAMKVLRPELSAVLGPERFLKEIEVTAALQHPHILPLFDSGEADGLLYYVMPFVEGETLRQRLERERQLSLSDAVRIAGEAAEALDYAHTRGVVHRDVKPENILLHNGHALVADFGIALAVVQAAGTRMTETGLSLGTPHYMAPEQAAGERGVDRRADVYALGAVTYEMLAGEPPFTGPTVQAIIARVVSEQPRPLTAVRRAVPEHIDAVIQTALEKVPADRFPTAAAFGAALTGTAALPARRTVRRRWSPLALAAGAGAGAALGLLGGFLLRSSRAAAPAPARRWSVELPAAAPVALEGPSAASGWQTAIALSPGGDRLAYVAPGSGTTVLAVRSLENDSVVTLPGTDGAYHPFFSPDGAWIGFFAGNLLRKVPAQGGPPVTLAQVDHISGAAWASNERIVVFERQGFDLHSVGVAGGQRDTTLHLSTQFGTPDVLPGGDWALGQLGSGQLGLLSLADGKELAITRRGVLALDSVRQDDLLFGTSPRWVAGNYVVFGSGDGVLTAMPFDLRRRQVTGDPMGVLEGMRMEAGFGYSELAVSREGTLAYVPGQNQLYVTLAFLRPDGGMDTLPIPRGPYTQARISPDGGRLALQMRKPVGGWQVVLFDLTSGVRQVVEVAGNYRTYPATWLPSGDLMIGMWDPVQFLFYGVRTLSLGTGKYTDMKLPGASYLNSAPDGRSFVYSDWRTGDIYIRPLVGDTTSARVPARGFAASFSPDGRWLAWGGVNGVGVSPVPATGAIHPVAERGEMPLWTPRGDAIIYRSGPRYYRVPVTTAGGFRAGRPVVLAEGPFLETFAWTHSMSPDGRLLVMLNSPERQARSLRVITGLPSLLGRLARE